MKTIATFKEETLAKYGIKMQAAIMKYDGNWDTWTVRINGQWMNALGIEIFALRKCAIAEDPELRQYMPANAMIVG